MVFGQVPDYAPVSIGIENFDGSDGIQVSWNKSPKAETAYKFAENCGTSAQTDCDQGNFEEVTQLCDDQHIFGAPWPKQQAHIGIDGQLMSPLNKAQSQFCASTCKQELTRLFLRCINRNSFSPPLSKLPGIISQVSVYSYSLQMCQVAATAGPLRMDPYVKLMMEHVDISGVTNATFAAKYETRRIWAQIVDGSVRSLYSVFGDADDHFVINATAPFFHVPPPFGSHFGGVNPQFDQYCPTCAYDSFLTVGITDGDAKNQLSQIGLEWNSFDKGQSFGTDDGMVFWMNPDKVHH